jgi:hypothetical protein
VIEGEYDALNQDYTIGGEGFGLSNMDAARGIIYQKSLGLFVVGYSLRNPLWVIGYCC